MKNVIEITDKILGRLVTSFDLIHINDVEKIAEAYANQFKYITTTTGERLIFDDEDYDFLRSKEIFVCAKTKVALTTYIPDGATKRKVTAVAKLILNAKPRAILRYKDRNKLNLRKSNLEIVTRKLAHAKQKKPKSNTSGYKGVSWNINAKKYGASIRIDGKSKHLGYYSSSHSAAHAYNQAAIKYWGKEYSELNVIDQKLL
jgi:hypothetical protein